MVEAISREIELQSTYLPANYLETIYFGGGTPSLLSEIDLDRFFETIHRYYRIAADAEITLEANPDDLSMESLRRLRRYVNRLSIGIQSFHEPYLQWMNRAHSALEAELCVYLAQEAGFENVSIDLMYGVGDSSLHHHAIWQRDLEKALALNVPHISSYCLTVEPGTVLGTWARRGKFKLVDDVFAVDEFNKLVQTLTQNGYEQYEISNFAMPGWEARHNSSYWKRRSYLGVGPSAHSYNGHSRQYNVSSNVQYLNALAKNEVPCTVEQLTSADQVNEYLLTGLRTKWGCQLSELTVLAGTDFQLLRRVELEKIVDQGWLRIDTHVLQLTEIGKLFANRIAADLFVEEDDIDPHHQLE